MQDRIIQNVYVKESESQEEGKIKFYERFTLGNICKLFYLFISVSFGHGSFGLIIYFMANKQHGIILTIGSVVSGSIHFLYEAYKVLYAEELLIKNMIWKNKIKIELIIRKNNEFNYFYKLYVNNLKEPS